MKHPLVISWFVATGLLTLGSILFVAFIVATTGSAGMIMSFIQNIVMKTLSMITLSLVYANLAPRLKSKALAPVGFIHLAITFIASLALFGALYYPVAAFEAGGPDTKLMQLFFGISSGLHILQYIPFIAALLIALNARLKTADTTFQ